MKKKALFYCTFPDPVRGFTGANLGNMVTYNLLKEDLDITVMDLGIKDFNPHSFSFQHIKYNFKILFHYFYKIFLLRKELKSHSYTYLYFLPGSASKGHLRDVLTVWIARPFVERIIGHNRNGNFANIYKRKWHHALTRYFVKSVDKFIFLSNNLRKEASSFLDDKKAIVAFNPIDSDVLFTRDEVDQKIERKQQNPKLRALFLSNMIESKGYKDVFSAAAILAKTFTDFEIHFVGRWNSKADEEEMNTFVEANNLSAFVHLHGKVTDRTEIKRMLSETDVFILPTYYPVEAQPRSIIEALNAGVPVIATRHASIPEMMEDGKEGFLVNKNAPEEIAAALIKLAPYNNWKEFATRARETFEKKFSYEAVHRQLLAAFSIYE